VAQFLTQDRSDQLDTLLSVGDTYCELSLAQLRTLLAALEETVPQLAELLSLSLPGDVKYCELLQAAHRQLADEAEKIAANVYRDAAPDPELDHELRALNQAVSVCFETPCATATPPASVPRPESRTVPRATGPTSRSTDGGRAITTDRFGLASRLSSSIRRCRHTRQPLTLLLAELDQFDALLLERGVGGVDSIWNTLSALLDASWERRCVLLQLEESQLAAVFEGCDREQGVRVARDVLEQVRRGLVEQSRCTISLSIGLASLSMPPRNYPASDLIDAAQRCLQGVKLSSGDGIKSIDLL
jgi:GGDEF domain-containing protein